MKLARIAAVSSFSSDKANKVPLAEGTHSRVTLWCLEDGQEIHPHTHAGDHVWVVEEGAGWFLGAEGQVVPVEPGTVLFAPAGEPHGMRAGSRLVFVSISAG
ncbi:MAG: cupin domain-containing protein [Proteobacteria bacterium]|nr:cupin domain-containing protein [Pseudomonadota bacterium]